VRTCLNKKIRVLVVDDSAFVRRSIVRMYEGSDDIEVVELASNGAEALELIKRLRPDVVTLDVMMPVLDGLTALEMIMRECPTPVVMFSSLTGKGGEKTLKALDLGAVDFIDKSCAGGLMNFSSIARELTSKIKVAARVDVEKLALPRNSGKAPEARSEANAEAKSDAKPELKPARPEAEPDARSAAKSEQKPAVKSARSPLSSLTPAAPAAQPPAEGALTFAGETEVVAIGTSTGGPPALQKILSQLPGNFPCPILIVQHMPEGFTASLAQRLDRSSALKVREAADGECLVAGTAYVAPGGWHMRLRRKGGKLQVALDPGPDAALHRPSVDVLFESVAAVCGVRSLAVVLTGMGKDGAVGAGAIKRSGGEVVVEAEESAVVFGMPRAVMEAVPVDAVVPLPEVAQTILRLV
jgi:two-component system, chemotaxis family, protein-glutamate methylesterase/glutaminase